MPVAIVNQSFAQRFFPGEEALGKRFTNNPNLAHAPGADAHWTTIVGIIGDVHHNGLDESTSPEVYRPLGGFNETDLVVAIRAHDTGSLAAALRNEVKAIDPNQPVFRVMTMEQLLSESLAARRLNMFLLGGFALLALVLAAVGIYGVLSYSVAQRSKEIGIRMALGATRHEVLGMILRESLLVVAAGAIVGAAAAQAGARVVSTLLFGVSAQDPATAVIAACVLVAAAVAAAFIPARRAAQTEPIVALRND